MSFPEAPGDLFNILGFLLSSSFQESLSEGAQKELLTLSEKMKHFGVHLGSWLLSTGLAFGCGAGIYFLCQYEQQVLTFMSFLLFTVQMT